MHLCRLSTVMYLKRIDQIIAPVADPTTPSAVSSCSSLRSCDPLPITMVGRLQKHPTVLPADALDVFLRLAPQTMLKLFLIDSVYALHYLRMRSHISPSQHSAVPCSRSMSTR